MCLALPWEVIERVIYHSANSPSTLLSFTLTCHDLNPCSTILLFGHRVKPRNRDQLLSLCEVLNAKPHLQPVVKSIAVHPNDFSPHPLLRMLHNLSDVEFAVPGPILDKRPPVITFHPCVLTYCREFGDNIHSLSLDGVDFPTLPGFSKILLSLHEGPQGRQQYGAHGTAFVRAPVFENLDIGRRTNPLHWTLAIICNGNLMGVSGF